jgi:hypothetical protein
MSEKLRFVGLDCNSYRFGMDIVLRHSREEEYLLVILELMEKLQPIFHLPSGVTEGCDFFADSIGVILDHSAHSRPKEMSR